MRILNEIKYFNEKSAPSGNIFKQQGWDSITLRREGEINLFVWKILIMLFTKSHEKWEET